MCAQLQAKLLPSLEMVGRINDSTDSLLGTDRPELVKGSSALNGRLVDSLAGVDIVRPIVGLNPPSLRGLAGGVVSAVGLDNVVLHQRVAGPTVDS
jgi:hypothetical protein